MQHMCFDSSVKDVSSDQAKISVDGGSSTPQERPALRRVIG
jgi:hypothetical protein